MMMMTVMTVVTVRRAARNDRSSTAHSSQRCEERYALLIIQAGQQFCIWQKGCAASVLYPAEGVCDAASLQYNAVQLRAKNVSPGF
jgi:hypothetical protein